MTILDDVTKPKEVPVLVAAISPVVEVAAVDVEALKQDELPVVACWIVNAAVEAKLPDPSWIVNMKLCPAGWFTVHCTGLLAAFNAISSTRFCPVPSSATLNGLVPPVQVT